MLLAQQEGESSSERVFMLNRENAITPKCMRVVMLSAVEASLSTRL